MLKYDYFPLERAAITHSVYLGEEVKLVALFLFILF